MKKTTWILTTLLALLILSGASCGLNSKPKQPVLNDGGIFKTTDKGENWSQKIALPTLNGVGNIGQVNVAKLVIDPQDSLTWYLLAEQGGLFFTYDGAETWQQAKSLTGRVNDLAVNPKVKCTIFISQGNKILKSTDCARSFAVMHFDTRLEQTFTALAVDYLNTEIIYAGMTTGDLLKSLDGGVSWTKIYNFGGVVKKLLMVANSSPTFYAVTAKGILKTIDSGVTWQNLSDLTNQYPGSREVTDLFFNASENNSLISLSRYGLLKTIDGGQAWNKIDLITPPGGVSILAAAVSPKSAQEIYYTTASTFYKTTDAGANWIAKKLPTTRTVTSLMFDPNTDTTMYLGTKFITSKK